MKYYTPWADLLDLLPTISQGHFHNLKLEGVYGAPTGERFRVWLSRGNLEDGEPFNRTVYIEKYDEADGTWLDVGYFDGDDFPLGGLFGAAYQQSLEAVQALA